MIKNETPKFNLYWCDAYEMELKKWTMTDSGLECSGTPILAERRGFKYDIYVPNNLSLGEVVVYINWLYDDLTQCEYELLVKSFDMILAKKNSFLSFFAGVAICVLSVLAIGAVALVLSGHFGAALQQYMEWGLTGLTVVILCSGLFVKRDKIRTQVMQMLWERDHREEETD